MTENFDKAFAFVIGVEGDLTDDPNDPGGLTKYGISQRAYPQKDIRNLTLDEAKAIYRVDYWDMCYCNDISYPLDVIVFDTAVNMGCSVSRRLDRLELTACEYLLQRIGLYSGMKNFNLYGRGWINRVMKLYNTFVKEA